ncbi:RNA polymerase I associated factor, A49-like protein [Dichotomopilus funicola]|uniref:RNA polymerase I associated factor, A49-like protein n=1 Tax=Dichotomopilus funicola TaxID=1934379 RepID=A0AAN6V179_9PEZI|nr:RNA polymerase I associated factor, A49-like protein [Dichotomopilus funicola]
MANSESKRRKRGEDETLPVRKKKSDSKTPKAAVAPSFAVTKLHKPQVSPPVVALTPGVSLPNSFPFNAYEKDGPPAAKRRKSSGTSELALHSTSHRTVDYTAREESAKSADKAINHFLAIIDPKTGEVEVIQAKKMVVRGTVRSKQAPPEAMKVSSGKLTHSEMKMELGETFGTKKAKKAIQAVAENAMLAAKSQGKLDEDDRALVGIIRDSSQHMATREELQAQVDQARPIPRGNFDAEEIQDVYIPAQIIGAEVLNAVPVLDWQEKVKKNEAVQVPARFVANRIVRVAGNEMDVQRLRLLRYLLWTITFFSTTRQGKERGTRSIARRDELRQALAPAPEMVVENIRRKFSDSGVMRKSHIDLLMTHCCVFALIIDNFEMNSVDLREDLKLEQKQLNQYLTEIGARYKLSKAGDTVQHLAKLSIPLQFPRMRMPPRRR